MSVILDLAPDIEQKLRIKAAEKGQTLEQYLQWLAADAAATATPSPDPNDLPYEEWLVHWRAWLEGHPRRDTVADDSRESIYEGCGE
jgi:hypothetical protein